jgi:uncharacterized protein YoxC
MILLVIITIAVVVFAITAIYAVSKVSSTIDNVNQGFANVKKDLPNIKAKGQNAVQNFVNDTRTTFPSLFNGM